MVQRKLLAIAYAIASGFAGIYSLSRLLYTGFSYTPSIILRMFFSSTCLPRHFLTVVVVAISVKSDVKKTGNGKCLWEYNGKKFLTIDDAKRNADFIAFKLYNGEKI